MNRRGTTLLEMIIATVILVVIIFAFVLYFSQNAPLFQRARVRQQLMVDARSVMETIQERLRNGKARTVVISTFPGTPLVPNSSVQFDLQSKLPSGAVSYQIYLDVNTVYSKDLSATGAILATRSLATHVTGLMFTGTSADPGVVGISLRMDAPFDSTGLADHVSSVILPNQTVRMVEAP